MSPVFFIYILYIVSCLFIYSRIYLYMRLFIYLFIFFQILYVLSLSFIYLIIHLFTVFMYLLILSMCLFIGLVLNQLFTLSSCHIIIGFLHVRCIPISQFDKTVPSKCVCVCTIRLCILFSHAKIWWNWIFQPRYGRCTWLQLKHQPITTTNQQFVGNSNNKLSNDDLHKLNKHTMHTSANHLGNANPNFFK